MRQSQGRLGALAVAGLTMLVLGVALIIAAVARNPLAPGRGAATSSAATAPSAGLTVQERGRQWVTLKDREGRLWTYQAAGRAPRDASGYMPVPRRASLNITARVEGRSIGIGLRAKADQVELADIQRNGRSVEVQVRLRDERGHEVHSARGALAKFGFG